MSLRSRRSSQQSNESNREQNSRGSTQNQLSEQRRQRQPREVFAVVERNVLPGVVLLESVSYYSRLEIFFVQLGWKNWLYAIDGQTNYYPELVIEFYDNLMFNYEETEPKIVSTVKGVTITLNRNVIAGLFDLPNDSENLYFDRSPPEKIIDFPKNKWWHTILEVDYPCGRIWRQYLKVDFYLLNTYLSLNILPTKGHEDELPQFQAFILHRFATKTTLNLPYIILRTMISAKTNESKSLPYGCYLTKIFHFFNVPINVRRGKPKQPYTFKKVYNLYKNSRYELLIEKENEENERGQSSQQVVRTPRQCNLNDNVDDGDDDADYNEDDDNISDDSADDDTDGDDSDDDDDDDDDNDEENIFYGGDGGDDSSNVGGSSQQSYNNFSRWV